MLCYVDDLILCGTKEAIRLVTDALNGRVEDHWWKNHLFGGEIGDKEVISG